MIVPERVHLIGIGGTGMSSIARVLLEKGKHVTGSDVLDSDVVRQLQRLGATVHIGHRASNVNGAELVITSTAIAPTNPEVIAARAHGIPTVHRSEMWANLINSGKGVTVAGAHGKTTITAMLAWTLHHSGVDPTYLIGGEIVGLGGGRSGQSGVVVAEADESDGSFLRYRPWCTVLTSIEADHLEHYNGDFTQLVKAYAQFLGNVHSEGIAVLCHDDSAVMDLAPDVRARTITYGFHADADYTAHEIEQREFTTSTTIRYRGEHLGRIELQIPGRHNVQNALAVIAVCRELGVSWDEIVTHIGKFHGVRRRFEVVGSSNGILIVDDYAHHPSEVRATLEASRLGWPDRRLIAVFQPHRYSRTHFLFDEFSSAFSDADHVIITDVFAPKNEKPIPGASSERLVDGIRNRCNARTTVELIRNRTDIPDHLAQMVKSGDIIVTMGAGDIWQTAREFARMTGNPT